jgi:hypothetical protein
MPHDRTEGTARRGPRVATDAHQPTEKLMADTRKKHTSWILVGIALLVIFGWLAFNLLMAKTA